MAKSAAQRFKEQRAKMKFFNENVVHPNAPVNILTSEEFKQQSRNRDKVYNRRMRGIGRIAKSGQPFKALTGGAALTIGNLVGKGARNVKRIFAPSDSEILQRRLERAYKKRFGKKKQKSKRQ
tara:strand:+ start:1343 stop:1711 length:369 start_codon:yes stop_codon:yes gene_type:complete